MTLLHQDPEAQAGESGEATPPEAPPAVRACPQCSAELADGQDWCLHCGQAQPGRLSKLPGKRAVATVFALTTVLVGGAVAASYAALQTGSTGPGSTPTELAQVTSGVPAPDTAVPAPAPVDPSTVVPTEPSSATPSDTTPPPVPDTSSTPKVPAVPTPSPTPIPTPTPSTSTGTSTGSSTTTPKDHSGSSKANPRTSTTATDTAPVPIKVDDAALTLYDPYTRNIATGGDLTKALDADPGTSYPITVAPGSGTIGAGLTVDLGKLQGIREVDLSTKTPGFKLEVYATDSDELPPDVLDTRWAHLKDVEDVGTGAGNKQIISLGSGTTKYRHVLLWFTAPPTDGLTVRVSELKLLG
ncbi:MAG TPA: hypothetical protein VGM33_19980 [Baekduia sp.]